MMRVAILFTLAAAALASHAQEVAGEGPLPTWAQKPPVADPADFSCRPDCARREFPAPRFARQELLAPSFYRKQLPLPRMLRAHRTLAAAMRDAEATSLPVFIGPDRLSPMGILWADLYEPGNTRRKELAEFLLRFNDHADVP